jgi:hypothetical protein
MKQSLDEQLFCIRQYRADVFGQVIIDIGAPAVLSVKNVISNSITGQKEGKILPKL